MKKILLFTICLATFGSANAQFKKITFTPGQSPAQTGQITPLKFKTSEGRTFDDFKVQSISSSELRAAASGFKVISYNEAGLPIAIEGASKKDNGRDKTIEQKAYDHLKELEGILKISNSQDQFKISQITSDEQNNQHVRMTQMYKGIPVFGSELLLHTQRGVIDFINGQYSSIQEEVNVTPSLEPDQSTSIIKKDLGTILNLETAKKLPFNLKVNESTLVLLPNKEGKVKLAYHHVVYKNIIDRWEYFIDAKSGEVIEKYQSICKLHNHELGNICSDKEVAEPKKIAEKIADSPIPSAIMDGPKTANALDLLNVSRTLNTYQVGTKFYLIDGSRPMFKPTSVMPNDPEGSIWTLDAFNTTPAKETGFDYDHVSTTNNTWTNKLAVSAHYNGGRAYEYFKNVHGRNSINGSGGNILSFINVADEDGTKMDNAFWNGAAIFYGSGKTEFFELARGLDVAAHEMAHGVVQNTANLVYQGESGALNESFADVFGVMVDRDDWLVGEDVVKPASFPSGSLRNMMNPHNGAAVGKYGDGFQPKLYSERYTGTQDNGGVHINSGIPNYAFYLFASNAAVGKDRAEKVYYRALSSYMTKNSKFIDCRIAVLRAAKELYGDAVETAAKTAFDQVGIVGTTSTTTQTDVGTNPGDEYVLFTTAANDNVYLYTSAGQSLLANGAALSQKNPISKFSVTDDGSVIMFVADDKKIHYIEIDWAKGEFGEGVLNAPGTYRNVAISKDGKRIAALRSTIDDKIIIFDLETGKSADFLLTNPTYTEGISTGDVQYADAMEWDFSGENVMYDALNEIKSTTAGTVEYWDIGFIKVWNKGPKTFALPNQIDKLFSKLEEGESVGNPTFSKNSPYIIALDYIAEETGKNTYKILGANIENGALKLIIENDAIGYPSYSKNDRKILFSTEGAQADYDVYNTDLANDKITGVANSFKVFKSNGTLGTYFSTGQRVISDLDPLEKSENLVQIVDQPVSNTITAIVKSKSDGPIQYNVIDITGKIVISGNADLNAGSNRLDIDATKLRSGIHFFYLKDENNTSVSVSFVKI
jgi:bacillolysin